MQFKFVCLNLWLGGKLFENIMDFIKKEQPDILALQEAFNGTDEKFPPSYRSVQELTKLGYPFSDFAPAFLDHRDGVIVESGNAVLSRYPIISSESFFYDQPYDNNYVEKEKFPDFSNTPRNLQHVQLSMEGKVLDIFNTQGIWGFDGADNERRLAMSKMIVEKVSGKDHVVLAGDFNTDQNTTSMENIGVKLKNIFTGELGTSFNMKHKPKDSGFGSAVVDMIFVSPKLRVLEHKVSAADVSDHLSLVCTLELP